MNPQIWTGCFFYLVRKRELGRVDSHWIATLKICGFRQALIGVGIRFQVSGFGRIIFHRGVFALRGWFGDVLYVDLPWLGVYNSLILF